MPTHSADPVALTPADVLVVITGVQFGAPGETGAKGGTFHLTFEVSSDALQALRLPPIAQTAQDPDPVRELAHRLQLMLLNQARFLNAFPAAVATLRRQLPVVGVRGVR